MGDALEENAPVAVVGVGPALFVSGDGADEVEVVVRCGRPRDRVERRTPGRDGGGSLGGKARGLAFANSMIAKSDLEQKFPEVTIRIPRIAVIGT
ncbi:MAG: hypothetical protein ACE5GO_03595, partial [Anaerolineales bacterium]